MDDFDLETFMTYAKTELGLSQSRLAHELGCGKNQLTRWRRGQCPRYIALALSAIVCRLPPLYIPGKDRDK